METITLYPSRVKKALESSLEVIDWLTGKGIRVFLPEGAALSTGRPDLASTDEVIRKESAFVVSMGGDGTLLRAARLVGGTEIPLLGINLGSLGFLTELPVASWQDAFSRLLQGEFAVVERMVLHCEVRRGHEKVFSGNALNDAVIHRGNVSRLLHLSIHINGRFAGTYSADGLVIASPTGSTAYSLSAGGPIVSPEVQCLILTAICPHTLSARPLVISEKEKVSVKESLLDGISLSLDGHINFVLARDDEILVEKAPQGIRFVHLETDFYAIVRDKLKWVAPPGAPPS
ncbi:MAG: NAD(+)/NADH kinase [Candidatus Eremiobacteraeota bacterium]|nr:NAD(+)/NADH kinase [Candidatus Eremiobacteraeota bacterium]